jgi:leader peptidase (prepilin peptidase) / N-methyltransferase
VSVDAQPVPAMTPEARQQPLPDVLIAGVAFVLAAACFLEFGVNGHAFVSALFVIVLTVLAAIDLERRIIPNRIVLPATAVILVLQIAVAPERALEWVVASLGAGLFFLIAFLTYRAGLGLGDVKLALLLGAGLGRGVVFGIFVGLLSSGIAGLVIVARHGLAARKRSIPLAPFLAFGAVVALFLGGSDFASF